MNQENRDFRQGEPYTTRLNGEEFQKRTQASKKKKGGFGKGFLAGMLVTVAIAAALIGGLGWWYGFIGSSSVLDLGTMLKINNLGAYIQQNYYEEVDTEDLRDGLYHGLFSNLDQYSVYYNEEEYQDLVDASIEGTYCGIGAVLQQDASAGTVTVTGVYDGSPAQEAGIQEGDMLLAADDYEAASMDLSEFVNHIRGEEGTTVHLTVSRDGESLEFNVERRNIEIQTVTYELLENQTGYIAVTEFTEPTADQFAAAIAELQNQGMTSLIVDLRSNPGGLLDTACEMLDQILPEGLLVYTEDNAGNREEYNSTDDEVLDIPLVVLVNGDSASASEIFAGAIQDRDAGTIIGTTTYGKGIVQSILGMTDGTAFKMTTERYYTPNGTCIHGIGITPDVEVEYEFLGGEEDTYSYDLDNQIQAALDWLEKENQ